MLHTISRRHLRIANMRTPYKCRFCETDMPFGASFCLGCGQPISDNPITYLNQPTHLGNHNRDSGLEMREGISLNRILFMTVISYGSYIFYWFYVTWKQYRDHTGEKAFPVWHALTQLIPFYGLFRMHAHATAFRKLMDGKQLKTTLSPGWATRMLVFVWLAWWGAFIFSGDVVDYFLVHKSQGQVFVPVAVDILVIGLIAWLLSRLQVNLNSYWYHISSGRMGFKKIVDTLSPMGAGEVIICILGILLWVSTVTTIFSEERGIGIGATLQETQIPIEPVPGDCLDGKGLYVDCYSGKTMYVVVSTVEMDDRENLPTEAQIKTYRMKCPEGGYNFPPDQNTWSKGNRWVKCARSLEVR